MSKVGQDLPPSSAEFVFLHFSFSCGLILMCGLSLSFVEKYIIVDKLEHRSWLWARYKHQEKLIATTEQMQM